MKIRIFQSDKGDCLLLSGKDGTRVLVDGGKKKSYENHVAPYLGGLKADGEGLDVVYVSHIDADHIEGVLELMDNLVEWKVHRWQREHGNDTHPSPDTLEPPEVKEIWHNAFKEVPEENEKPIAEIYATWARILADHPEEEIRREAVGRHDLALSQRQAIKLSRRIGGDQLKIPLNPPADGGIMFATDGQDSFTRGSMEFFTIGPFEDDLEKLRDKWNAWLKKNADALEKIRRKMEEDEADLLGAAVSGVSLASSPVLSAAEELGNRGDVTPPNLASLMFLVEEDEKTVLLTGDGHCDDILKGLKGVGKLGEDAGLHVDVLKVMHHGSEHNFTKDFAKTITADHYLFCGDGAHENPDVRVVEGFLESRLGEGEALSGNAQVGDPFKLWFSSSPEQAGLSPTRAEQLEAVEKVVRRYQRNHPGRIRCKFLKNSSMAFEV